MLRGSENAAFWPVLNSKKNLALRQSSENDRARDAYNSRRN
jgi:hypothetical protein